MPEAPNNSSPPALDYARPRRRHSTSWWRVLAILSACVVLTGIGHILVPDWWADGWQTAAVQVLVTDAATGQPIPSARVSALPHLDGPTETTVLTDASGAATFTTDYGHAYHETLTYSEELFGSARPIQCQQDGYAVESATLPSYAHYTRILFWHLTHPPFAPKLHFALTRQPATPPTTKPN